MRLALLASVVLLLAVSVPAFAQEEEAPPPVAPPEELPARPVPVEEPLPPPTPTPPPPAPMPPPPPTATVLFPDYPLDGFATRFWVNAEYLLWWTKDNALPALLTTGSPRDHIPGALGQPGTQVLVGGDVDSPVRSGARFSGGYWFTRDQLIGWDGTFFFLGGQFTNSGYASNGDPVLTRPFYDVTTGRQNAFLVAYPGRQAGALETSLGSRFWGADTNLRSLLFRGPSYQVSVLGGFRFLDLHERLRLREDDTLLPQSSSDALAWTTTVDHFRTSNQFYGGQLGTDLTWGWRRLSVNVLAKVALGASVQRATIGGWTAFGNASGQGGSVGVGELALPTNIGWSEKDQFAVVPEAGVNLGYSVTRHVRLTFGYTFIYWSHVFRPGDQVDPAINPTQFAALSGTGTFSGAQRPTFTFKDSDFWAQGLNFGVQVRY